MRSVSQQSEQQLRLAREARADQRAAEHRRSRREAYVRFLTESLEATALVRTARAPGIPEGTLEGPDTLADAVQEVRDSLRMELDLVRAVRQGSKTDEQLRAARSARATAAGAMAEKARKALGGDIDTA
jgi:hypothetical protein